VLIGRLSPAGVPLAQSVPVAFDVSAGTKTW
jgi:hypothetical protein